MSSRDQMAHYAARRAGPVLLALLALGSAAVACGPFFPWQLLDNRRATLHAVPANRFDFEARHLRPAPQPALPLPATSVGDDPDDQIAARAKAESAGLTDSQGAQLAKLRQAPNGDAALAVGAALPEPVRLYAAASVDFGQGRLAQAADRYEAVLHLSPQATPSRAVWAAFMLGRLRAASGDPTGAVAAFRLSRTLTQHGAPDPLGLALASLGEEARLALARNALGEAVALYAQQAAAGSDGAVQSLRMVAEKLLDDPATLATAVRDPLVQRLLVAFVLARVAPDGTIWDFDRPADALPDENGQEPTARTSPRDLAGELMTALANLPTAAEGADRVAALAYRTGRYKLADMLARKAGGPLAAWVRAKLAVQDDNLPAAAAFYAQAVRAFPPVGGPLEPDSQALLRGESGVVALERGEFVQALTLIWPVADSYWGDVAYLAERVLTTDELRDFVAVLPPRVAPSPGADSTPDRAADIRALLARRLMRDGRFAEAVAVFRAIPTVAGSDDLPTLATAYQRARSAATGDWWRSDRAEAAWSAALLARQHGMELLGTEGPPDFAVYDGDYDAGLGQTTVPDTGLYSDAQTAEMRRFDASRAHPDLRFHYRYLAVTHATQAADLLPPRSQAYAAILCAAAGWMQESHDQQAAWGLWQRYVRNGAVVPFATHFGQDCPAPDFASLHGGWRAEPVGLLLRAAHDGINRLHATLTSWRHQ